MTRREHSRWRLTQNAVTPRVIVPLLIGLFLIVALLHTADVGRVLRIVSTFRPVYLLFLVVFSSAYEALRAVQWFLLLRTVERRVPVPWRAALMAYLGGEVAKSLPGGQYVQTYLLRQAQGVPIARSVAVTTFILWLEVVNCLLIALIVGIAPWPWIRPIALLLLGGIGLVVLALTRRPGAAWVSRATAGHRRWQAACTWVDDFSRSMQSLLAPHALGPALVLSLGYIACAALGLWAIATALGVSGIGPSQALVCYAVALGVGLLIPLPMDLGLTEGGGVAALMACGVSTADALAIMLIQRVLGALLTSPLAAAGLVAVRQQVGAALRLGGWGRHWGREHHAAGLRRGPSRPHSHGRALERVCPRPAIDALMRGERVGHITSGRKGA